MSTCVQSLRAQVTKAVALGELNIYQANQMHAMLSFKPEISTATELTDLKAAILATRFAGIIGDDQVGQIFSIIPELEAA